MKIDDFRKLADFEIPHTQEDQQKILEFLHGMGIDPSNIYQELEMSSPFVDTHRDTSFSNARVSLHSHTFYELLYCRSVTDVEYIVGSERYRLRSGDIIFISPGISHRPILPESLKGSYVRDVIWISPDYVERIKEMLPHVPVRNSDYLIRTAGTGWEFLGDLFHTGVWEAEQRKTGWEAVVLGNTMKILAYLERACRDRNTDILKAEKPDLLGKVTAHIEEHYAEYITVGDLAHKFYVSDSTISHMFKHKMGISLYRYITQRRLIAAKLLIAEKVPMEEISRRVGFADYSSFYRAFKQEYGISPRQYRNL